MKVIDPIDLIFEFDRGEEVKVEVLNGKNIQDFVNYDWKSVGSKTLPKNVPYTRNVAATDPKPSYLGVNVYFWEEPGGEFTLKLTGSNGGEHSLPVKRTPKNEKFRFIQYELRATP